MPALALDANRNGSILGRELQGVGDEVSHHLLQLMLIRHNVCVLQIQSGHLRIIKLEVDTSSTCLTANTAVE